jgi:acetoin utilization deacetylase AcuC-like enzyme
MIIIYSNQHHLHHPPTEFLEDGLVPYTESPSRAEAIISTLRAADFAEIVEPDDFGLDPIRAVHTDDYLEHLQNIYQQWTATNPASTAVIPFAFPRQDLERFSSSPYAMAGYYAFDLSAPITATSWDAILSSAYCALTGARKIQQGNRFVYALCRPPGHHASQDLMGGYCYLNNAAIAAEDLTQKGQKRVAIVDIDVHSGNGTQRIFYERDDVLFISIHGSPEWEYPYFMGYSDERGAGAGLGYTFNYPMAQGVTDPQYLSTLDQALSEVVTFGADTLVISAGFDTFDGDPLGKFKLTTSSYHQMGQRFAALNLPTLVIQEGGYKIPTLGANVLSLLQGLLVIG